MSFFDTVIFTPPLALPRPSNSDESVSSRDHILVLHLISCFNKALQLNLSVTLNITAVEFCCQSTYPTLLHWSTIRSEWLYWQVSLIWLSESYWSVFRPAILHCSIAFHKLTWFHRCCPCMIWTSILLDCRNCNKTNQSHALLNVQGLQYDTIGNVNVHWKADG